MDLGKTQARLRRVVDGRIVATITNALLIASIVLLFAMRIVPFSPSTIALLDRIDAVILTIFLIEFTIRAALFGWHYVYREFGWIDLLACLPLLAPVIEMGRGFQSLRLARIIRLVRIVRVMRLVRTLDGGEATSARMSMRTTFFVGVSSVALLILLASAVLITLVVDRAIVDVAPTAREAMLNRIELVVMFSAVGAALAVTAAVNHFLRVLVTRRVETLNTYLESVLDGGNKIALSPDEMGDEISRLGATMRRIGSFFPL